MYNEALKKRDWNNRDDLKENRRRKWSFGLWFFGFITTFIPVISCYHPESIYEIFHCQVPVLVDGLATFECVCVVYFLTICSNTTYYDWIGCGIGVLGCVLSLLSSVGGLGSTTNVLIHISYWYFGATGFFVATIPRTYPKSLLQKLWDWMRTQFGTVEAAQRENPL